MSSWEAPGRSDEWYTPKYVFDCLGTTFDLDVAAPIDGPLHVPAGAWISRDSLNQPWRDFIWMNAPFEGRNGLAPWLSKFFEHGNGIALVPDRTSAPWFQEAWPKADLVLFVFEKIKFIRTDGSLGRQPGSGTALMASGERAIAALHNAAARRLGFLAQPLSIREAA